MKQDFFSVKIDVLDSGEALERCKEILIGNKCQSLFFINAHCFNVAVKNPEYLNALNKADMLLNDGIGMKLGSYFAGIRFRENMNGTDFIPEVIRIAHTLSMSAFLIGAKPGVAESAAAILNLKAGYRFVAGYHNGYFNKTEEAEIIESINKSKAELLILGMGVPIQELWINQHMQYLPHVKLAVAGGAIIDFISGNIKRAPVWMRKAGLEWLYRFIHEPRRLFKRYFIGNFVFLLNVTGMLISKAK